MDVDRFGLLTCTLASPLSRRVSLGGLAIGGMLVLRPGLAERSGLARKGKERRRGTRTVRRSVTRTFTNSAPITFVAGGAVTPYPSLIEVSGFANGRILDVNLTLNQLPIPTRMTLRSCLPQPIYRG